MRISGVITKNKDWIDSTWEKLVKKIEQTAIRNRDKLPYKAYDGVYDDMRKKDVCWWTNGFFGGLMWLMHLGTGNDLFKDVALHQEKMLDDCFLHVEELHHDVGFMWHILSGVNYRLNGDVASRSRNIMMANLLAARLVATSDYIRAWNFEDTEELSIIDTMMNLPLLYWASKELDDPNYKKIAMIHADMAMRDHVRADGSVHHIVEHDPKSPNSVKGYQAGQGYAIGSSWSRGCAWAVYGFALSHLYTQKAEYLDTARRCADYFIDEVKKTDYLAKLDFRQPDTPMYYDSTAGVVCACGLIQIAGFLPESQGEIYLDAALKILRATEREWCDWDEDKDSVLQMASDSYVKGVHTNLVYADFFLAEALLKLKAEDFLIW